MKTGSKVMNWRKEFDNRFSWEINGFDGPREEIIDFIDQAIQSERERVIKIIESKMVGGGEIVTEYYEYYNQALEDIKAELEREQK